MRFGLWYDFRNPLHWERPFVELYDALLEQITYAEELGYDSVWLSEHHFLDDGYCPSLLPVAAAVAARTRRIRIGTSLVLLPLHHPLRIAEDAAVVDIISHGRFSLGVGLGYRLGEFEGFGASLAHRRSLMEEGVEIIKRAWADGPFSFQGRHFQMRDVNVTPKPVQRPGPPILMGALVEAATRRAARIADGLLLTVPGRGQYDLAMSTLRELGRDPAAFTLVGSLNLFVSQDPDRDWEVIKEHALYRVNAYAQWFAESAGQPARPLTDADELRRSGQFVIGEPKAIIRAIERYRAEVPIHELCFWATMPGLELERGAASLELFAREVMPHFRS